MRAEERERIPNILNLANAFEKLPLPLSQSTDEAFPGMVLQWTK